MKRIKYISYYDTLDSTVKRNYVLAASNKMDYIISVINKCGVAVDVISFSGCLSDKLFFDNGGVKYKGVNTVKHFSSFGPTSCDFVRLLSRYWQIIQFVIWFLFSVSRNEKIMVYHSLGYCKILTMLKRIKGCVFIGEVEEIYQDVTSTGRSLKKAEYDFIACCDMYIFPTKLLNEKLNNNQKPYIIIHGIYDVESKRDVIRDDSTIHVVYAGTFDPNKGGLEAASAATYLPDNYHVHICGFGTELDTAQMLDVIKKTSNISKAKLSYEGLLKGEEFIQFIQKCHIGLSTQNPFAAFNSTSFPSKVLTYLANGLSVVSIRIPAIENSAVGDYLSYYDEQSPMEIANAIIRASKSIDNESTIQILNELDRQFIKDVNIFLNHE